MYVLGLIHPIRVEMNRLKKYKSKRDFTKTLEPSGSLNPPSKCPKFCVQKHAARHLHYDFRLEYRGVLLSWAVPKGPSLNPEEKRLAIQVEDHPLDYQYFEGVIPKGNYGAGTVETWDHGTYYTPGAHEAKEIERDVTEGLKKGHLNLILNGGKLKGAFSFVKLKKSADPAWLLIKTKDAHASHENVIPHQEIGKKKSKKMPKTTSLERSPSKRPKKI